MPFTIEKIGFTQKDIHTSPPEGDYKAVTNLYVDLSGGTPKLKIEYEDED